MNSLRESIVSIPGALSNILSESASTASSFLHGVATPSLSAASDTPTNASDSETTTALHTDKSLPIPATLVKEQWRLIFTSDANEKDLEAAIGHCGDLVMLSDECSEERKWLVRHLIDLRYALQQLQAAAQDPNESGPEVKTVVGHHFGVACLPTATRNYCDHCTGIIWSVVQASYICSDCHYQVHQKCMDSVVRVCAHVLATDRQYPIADICPEVGLAAQRYKCAECETLLNCKNSWIEPRLCDYTGLYYCPSCHWNDSSVIPARIVHNWDFTPRKVARVSLQEINLFLNMPLIKLEEANPKLFVFLDTLVMLRKLRQNLVFMRKYLAECRGATENKIIDNQIGHRRYLIQTNEFYSINDLAQTESGALSLFLNKIFNVFDAHIRKCAMCTAKAYICEICSNNEVIFPFDDGCILCEKCNSIYHRVCMTRKNMICPKCVRMQERKLQLERADNEDDED